MFDSPPAVDVDGVSAETPACAAVSQRTGERVDYFLCVGELMHD